MRTNKQQGWRSAAGLVLTVLALTSCDKQKVTGPTLVYTGPLMETTNVVELISDSAKLKFQLTAPLQQQFENSDFVWPKGVKVTFYSPDGKKTVVNTLTAKYGKYDKAKNLYTMRGAVQVVNVPKAQRMDTEELFFDKNKQIIYTDSAMAVRVETPTEILSGHGLWAKQDLNPYRIYNPTGIIDKVGAGL
ncbi:LPS export ABC transporter periplasmic protein LptC [Hymenobacter sp. BT523]|uniref:LPS export ABC transporter periplasmic protein LptC n=1 Tax=Hymenobacter sp. BT523 TaxID=2795725 RepID=UPI0018EB8192|nr:LPS export ABC transporter periplasmic protein LptC [Hymenobacter sp. BT523]MBJ6107544.1 LPS export ABC transporter periplasmic protein LptC [Hymenobacter sp. BT523]